MSADLPDTWPSTLQAARMRLAAVRPAKYARSRNHLDGAVTRLSPYVTHGFLHLPEVLAAVVARHRLDLHHKFVQELGWRAYFHHVWHHEGERIFASLHDGVLPDEAYARALPRDLREGATGVPVIDTAVRTLYATGWLHNHVRMWLASYVVHLRKVHWRAGADWLFAHLIDGDLASNHLSWQWVAGTGSHKPYLFNADNVARYAPPGSPWLSPGSVIDTSYEMLDQLARQGAPVPGPGGEGIAEPSWRTRPPDDLFDPLDPACVEGRTVWLMHPWALGPVQDDLPPDTLCLGWWPASFHSRWPWSERRWRFVGDRLRAVCEAVWWVDAQDLAVALARARRVDGWADPHLGPVPWPLRAPPSLFGEPGRRCRSFSQFWQQVTRGLDGLDELPGLIDARRQAELF